MSGERHAFPPGGGALGALMRRHDWTESPIGTPESWPVELKSVVAPILMADAQIVLFWGPDFVALYNDAYAPTIGDKHPGALGRPASEYWSELWDDLGPLLRSVRDTGRTVTARDRPFSIDRNGFLETVYFDISYSAVPDETGAVAGVLCLVNETTERVLAEAALRESEARFRNMADHAPVMMWVTDASGSCTYLNRRWYEYTGQTEAEAEGFGWLDRTHPGDRAETERIFLEANAAQRAFRLEYRIQRADGAWRWAIDAASPRFDADGVFVGFIGSVIDIDERIAAETALRESEANFQAIANSIDQMVWATRPDGFHDYYNDRWYEYTGVPYGTTDGEGWNGMFHPEDQPRAWELWRHSLETGEPYRIEYRLRHRSGVYRWVLGRASPVRDAEGRITRWFGTCTDIQEIVDAREVLARSRVELEEAVAERSAKLLQAETQLRQMQKMEAIGQLTGGIAHDFNNMLAVIMGGLNLLQRRLQRGETDVGRYIASAMEGATRAAALTQRLLAFSRQQPLSPEVVDPNRLVADMTELLTRTLGEQVEVETVLAAGLWKVNVDASQLENAILNLAVNGRDAMPDGGRLTIETGNAYADDDYGHDHDIPAGQYVLIAVSDTGTGMTPEVMARAFDPFFTTKEVGKGTGLGLSQVFGFVRQSGGHVKIYSEVGHGTTMKIYLPRHYGAQGEAEERRGPLPSAGGSPHEVILVVEDEERVRNYSVEALRELGYTVVHASGGREALRMLEAGQEIGLLFTDVVMPEMTGRQLADAARARNPALKVLYTTGYTRNAIVHNGVLDPGTNLLPKPFGIEQLAQKVRQTLDG